MNWLRDLIPSVRANLHEFEARLNWLPGLFGAVTRMVLMMIVGPFAVLFLLLYLCWWLVKIAFYVVAAPFVLIYLLLAPRRRVVRRC